jgi:hypothetical protein
MDQNPDEMCAIRTETYALARKIVAVPHSLSLELASYMFTNNPDLDSIQEIFTQIAEGSPTLRGENQSLGRLDAEMSSEAKYIGINRGVSATNSSQLCFQRRHFFQMIHQCGWVLLDCVEHAPHEGERLII